jgi:hypothetical protein
MAFTLFNHELETRHQSKFLTLCGLSSGNNKPPPETIFNPFVEHTISLFENGFDWHDSSGKKNKGTVQVYDVIHPFPSLTEQRVYD